VHACFWLLAPLGYLLVMATPGRERRWRMARALSRLLVRLTGIPLKTEGLDAVPRDGPCVTVANHASYIDGLVLMAALPRPVRFVAKVELARQAVAGAFLRRIGAVFVERFDWRAGARDAERIVAHAKAGDALLYFPEGTFTREAGLMPFKLGAFMAAAEAGAPVVPVAVAGTRSILRAGSGFPRRHPLRIKAGAPIQPDGSGWQAATHLRDQARAHILRHIDEPDLAARQ
jgi:1-acyl-sn-glycerol-3-phosphate acyltransferase